MSRKLLSTGQAAKLFSVTPDTILKWIKNGWVPARRTAGGHYRIEEGAIERAALHAGANNGSPTAPESEPPAPVRRSFQYCWEFNSAAGRVQPQCHACAVYQMRAYRCYEVLKLAPSSGHARLFCKKTCEECDYYNRVHRHPTRVLVVTDNDVLSAALRRSAGSVPFDLEITHCEYTCSALIETFRPDFAVVDCAMGKDRSRDITEHLLADSRVPYVRVILAADQQGFPKECEKRVFARMQTPFGIDEIAECLQGVKTH